MKEPRYLQSKVNEISRICFCPVVELKMPVVAPVKIFEQSPTTIIYAGERRKVIPEENNYRLIF